MNRKELFPLLVKGMSNIYLCYCDNFKLSDIQHHLENDVEYNVTNYIENVTCCVGLEDLNKLISKFKEIIADFAGIDLNDVSLQPSINALKDAYDLDTAAAFNTKIYQLIASDIQDSKTNSALQQQLETLCNQVETLTGQVQQLSEQIQQLKNPPTKSE